MLSVCSPSAFSSACNLFEHLADTWHATVELTSLEYQGNHVACNSCTPQVFHLGLAKSDKEALRLLQEAFQVYRMSKRCILPEEEHPDMTDRVQPLTLAGWNAAASEP